MTYVIPWKLYLLLTTQHKYRHTHTVSPNLKVQVCKYKMFYLSCNKFLWRLKSGSQKIFFTVQSKIKHMVAQYCASCLNSKWLRWTEPCFAQPLCNIECKLQRLRSIKPWITMSVIARAQVIISNSPWPSNAFCHVLSSHL